MSVVQLLAPFLVTWFGIHTFLFLLQRFLNRPNLPVGPGSGSDYELLPTTTAGTGGQLSPGASISKSGPNSGLLVKPFHVRFSTTVLNSFFFRLGNAPKLACFWRIWYGLGVIFGVIAMVFGWALLAFAAIKLLGLAASFLWTLSPLRESDSHQEHHQRGFSLNRLKKRDLNEGNEVIIHPTATGSTESEMVLVPIIPGITLPLSHLPYYLIALLVSGVFHEAGHAIAAAREKTQLSSAGIFLYILYPGAFVDIPSRALAIMSPLQQLRVICAGVWHNIVFFIAAWLFLASGALQLSFRLIGWKQMNDGLSIVDIAPQSPLHGILKTGAIITKLNDIPLQGDPFDIWSNTLLKKGASTTREAGFCIPNTFLFTKPSDCCLFTPTMQFGHSRDRSLSCFIPFDPSDTTPTPQEDNPTCGADGTCYRPFSAYGTATIVRIYYLIPSWMESAEVVNKSPAPPTDEQVILYQGNAKDIWDAVQVTTMGSRWSFLPLWLPNAILLTIRYTMSFSLALSVLNIVPARHLDGHHALKALVALLCSIRQSYKSTQSVRDSLKECLLPEEGSTMPAAVSTTTTATFHKIAKAVKGVVVSTTLLLGGVMIGSLVQLIAVVLWK
ncbi:Membrane-bound transcription factor site-2 protease [Modicella reniformis]|uniref:Endopeptidase S2P n=1 Tax=Modicella reniformis TaxID=1440133 RepID=A0A9P6ML64_9FUNG|nr:Membrane-bound transcription factor site-2 protease [Modicella reniformis]